MAGYPGSKNASGVAERIIREMPPHRVYVEAFAGYAAVFRKKRPAALSILIDADPATCEHLRWYIDATDDAPRADILCDNALVTLPSHPAVQASDALVYFDAPYLRSVRTRLLYDFELSTPESHALLLEIATGLPCMAMVSHYLCDQYAEALRSWRLVKIPAMTRGGMRTECLWCNFPEPRILHDPRWAGQNFRERERIKRKGKRWIAKFAGMDPRERQVIATALAGVDRAAMEAAMAAGNGRSDDAADGS